MIPGVNTTKNLVMVDPCIYDTTYPFPADIDSYICPIAALFAGGECRAAESVEFISDIWKKAANKAI